jgi:hydrogenase maturation protein HypF
VVIRRSPDGSESAAPSDPSTSAGSDPVEGRRFFIRGTVQGVGMRPFVWRLAHSAGVRGRVRNDGRGVTIEAFGSRQELEAFARRLSAERPPAARYDDVQSDPIPFEAAPDFVIIESESAEAATVRRVSIPPDMATCDACLAEVLDPANRRHRYPFTNCTDCGPRFTIAQGVPYDRAATTMAPFRMCPDCQSEYQSPADRRFHAEPNACPVCGPRVWLEWPDGTRPEIGSTAAGDPIATAASALRDGRILALKGIGGFHLACDATSPEAVGTLRERKRREEKPLAVMVADLAAAERLAELTADERALLVSVERPIVLCHRRGDCGLAPEVAPDTPLVGLFLPYSPLHHLLLGEAGRPLVMTSGNLSEEPIAFLNPEARVRLGAIADLFLVHDREIETRADDSVARLVAGRPLIMRRSRGYVPRPIALGRRLPRPVLACGAHLKNTFCLAAGDQATLGPHIGDLENLETYGSLEASVERLERFLRLRPEVVAHDLHPQYLSTRYAQERAAALGVPAVAVQHHHAHVAACMAEHRLEGPVLGLAWDGTGLGTDGASWGGELLLATFRGFERLATLRPMPLAGGDRAVREPWRVALAVLDQAFGGDPPLDELDLFAGGAASDATTSARATKAATISGAEITLVRRMIATGFNTPPAHGAGRLFDALGALALGRGRARYEGQVAMALESAADRSERGHHPLPIDLETSPWQLDWRPLVRGLVADLLAGRGAPVVAARFHESLALGASELVRAAIQRHGRMPVVLSGGCFQNARLTERILEELSGDLEVHLHRQVPPGDGGVALGQAVVASALSPD